MDCRLWRHHTSDMRPFMDDNANTHEIIVTGNSSESISQQTGDIKGFVINKNVFKAK